MRMHEDFLRCPNCNYNQFEEQKQVILNKDAYNINQEVIINEKRLTYICNQCGQKLTEVVEQQ